MREFFQPNLNLRPEDVFPYLSPPHWVYLGGWAAVTILLCMLMRNKSSSARDSGLKVLVYAVIVSEIARIVWGVYFGVFMWQDWLPLHLCAIMVFIGPVIIYSRNERVKSLLMSFVYGVSMPAALFALLTPNKPVATPFCFEFFQTMFTHGAIICMGVYLIAVKGFRPRARVVPALLMMTLGWMAVCFGVNTFINTVDPKEIPWAANYMFLTFPPKDTPLEAFAGLMGRWYMIPSLGILLGFWVVLFVPWEIFYKHQKH